MSSFVPENAVEHALVRAVSDPAARRQFEETLLASEVFVMTGEPEAENGRKSFERGDTVNLVSVAIGPGEEAAAFFSSLRLLVRFVGHETGYLRIAFRDLLELTRGDKLILNPGSDYGKIFLPGEVERLLVADAAGPRQVQPWEVRLGRLANPPIALAEALTAFFASRSDVEAAWISGVQTSPNEPPHPLVCIRTSTDWTVFSAALGPVIQPFARQGTVDVVPAGRSAVLDEHFATLQPFYGSARKH
jgi:hypothetical protein